MTVVVGLADLALVATFEPVEDLAERVGSAFVQIGFAFAFVEFPLRPVSDNRQCHSFEGCHLPGDLPGECHNMTKRSCDEIDRSCHRHQNCSSR